MGPPSDWKQFAYLTEAKFSMGFSIKLSCGVRDIPKRGELRSTFSRSVAERAGTIEVTGFNGGGCLVLGDGIDGIGDVGQTNNGEESDTDSEDCFFHFHFFSIF